MSTSWRVSVTASMQKRITYARTNVRNLPCAGTCSYNCPLKSSRTCMREYFQSILDGPIFDQWRRQPWKPIWRPAAMAWLVFYAAFMAYALSAHGGFLFIDSANLVVHDG